MPPPRLLSASTCLADSADPTARAGVAATETGVLDEPGRRAASPGPARRASAGVRRPGTSASGSTGLVKNDPTLQVSWSSASSTMPLPRRRPSTAIPGRAPRGNRRAAVDAERAGQLRVADRGARAVRAQPEPDPQHDGVVAVLEHAGAVAQPELGRRDVRADLAGAPVVEVDVDEQVRDLHPVGAHVLHRGGAGAARDAGQALQPAEPRRRRVAATSASQSSPASTVTQHACRRAALDAPCPALRTSSAVPGTALVRDHDVRAAAEQQQRLARGVGGPHGVDDLAAPSGVDQPVAPGRRCAAWCAGRAGASRRGQDG